MSNVLIALLQRRGALRGLKQKGTFHLRLYGATARVQSNRAKNAEEILTFVKDRFKRGVRQELVDPS